MFPVFIGFLGGKISFWSLLKVISFTLGVIFYLLLRLMGKLDKKSYYQAFYANRV